MKYKYINKFILAVVIIAIMALMLTVDVSAGEIKRITILGDSISEGYGLGENEKNYGQWLGEYYDAEVENLALSGDTTQDLIDKLEADDSIRESMEIADLICVSIGGNDLMGIFFDQLDEAAQDGVSVINGELNISPELIEKIIVLMYSSIGTASVTAVENLENIIGKIRAVNPDAKVVFQTVYNPFETESDTMKYVMVPLNNFCSMAFSQINDYIINNEDIECADIKSKFKGNGMNFTNINEFDIHPNSMGHFMIAEEIVQVLEISGNNSVFENGLNELMPENLSEEIKEEFLMLSEGQFRGEDISAQAQVQTHPQTQIQTQTQTQAYTTVISTSYFSTESVSADSIRTTVRPDKDKDDSSTGKKADADKIYILVILGVTAAIIVLAVISVTALSVIRNRKRKK